MNRTAVNETAVGRDEQAAGWCMRLAEGSLNPAEQRSFDDWCRDAFNRQALEQASMVWRGIEETADRPEVIHLRSQALEQFRRANGRRWSGRFVQRWRSPLAVASSLAGAAAIYLVLTAPQVYDTGIGERRVVTLEDGSQLSLDADTRVKVRLADDRRELRLVSGRAKFTVAKDPLRPFSVTLGDKVVVATGTSFSVELLQRHMHVVLYEGRVVFMGKRKGADAFTGAELTPGHELVTPLDGDHVTIEPADLARASSWESGQISFAAEPLAPALERLNRYSTTRLVLGSPRLASLRIDGVFTAGDVEAFIEGVTGLFPVDVQRRGGTVTLTDRGTEKNRADAAVPR